MIDGVHIHHQVWGILLVLVVGLLAIAYRPRGVSSDIFAALFGVRAALASALLRAWRRGRGAWHDALRAALAVDRGTPLWRFTPRSAVRGERRGAMPRSVRAAHRHVDTYPVTGCCIRGVPPPTGTSRSDRSVHACCPLAAAPE